MAIAMSSHGVHIVAEFGGLLKQMLGRATSVHQTNSTEHPLNKSDIADLIEQLESAFPPALTPELKKKNQYAVIETAVRDTFNTLLVRRANIETIIGTHI
jgi:THO complex subunit 1